MPACELTLTAEMAILLLTIPRNEKGRRSSAGGPLFLEVSTGPPAKHFGMEIRFLRQALKLARKNKGRADWPYIQRSLDEMLSCPTAYGGSVALFLSGQTPTWGDIDVLTNRLLTAGDLLWPVDQVSRFGLKNHELNLDIFYVDRADNEALRRLANDNIITVDGLRIQDPDFVRSINWFWRSPEKNRHMTPSDDPELAAALR